MMKNNKILPQEMEISESDQDGIVMQSNVANFNYYCKLKRKASKWKGYRNTERASKPFIKRTQSQLTNEEIQLEAASNKCFQRSMSASDKGVCFLDDSDQDTNDSQQIIRTPTQNNEKILIHYFITLGKSKETHKTIDLDFIESLLKAGTDIACCDKYGQTVLHETARMWHVDVARFLVEHGAPVNCVDDFGRSPLHVAAALDYPEMLEYLLSCHGDVNLRTFGENQTLLHYAAKHDAVDSLKFLLKRGMDMAVVDYKGRTPLQLAAELDRSETCKVLVDEGARIGVQDDSGMTAIVVMITKMPPVAVKAMDEFHKTDRANRKQLFYLNHLQPLDVGEASPARSAIEVAVDHSQFDLLLHPVMKRLLEVEWDAFGRFGAWYLMIYNFICCVLWTALVCTYPPQAESVYTRSRWYRILLTVLSMGTFLQWLVSEVREYRRSHRVHSRFVKWRINELERDLRYCHPRWPEEHAYIHREIKELKEKGPRYLKDWWNYLDLITYGSIIATIVAHVINLIEETKQSYRIERAIASVMLVFIWLRLMKHVRAFKILGPFVVMMQHVTYDVLRIGFLLSQFYIPYAAAFWVVFGSQGVEGYDNILDLCYNLLQIMVVGDFGYENLEKHDSSMAKLLCGTYIVISSIICLNLFIALLSDTFQRVYDNAKANAEMQRAAIIVSIGNELPQKRLQKFQQYIHLHCAPEVLYYDDDSCEPEDIKLLTQQIKESVDTMKEVIDEDIRKRNDYQSVHTSDNVSTQLRIVEPLLQDMNERIDQLNRDANDLKSMINTLLINETQRQYRKQLRRKRKSALQMKRMKESYNKTNTTENDD